MSSQQEVNIVTIINSPESKAASSESIYSKCFPPVTLIVDISTKSNSIKASSSKIYTSSKTSIATKNKRKKLRDFVDQPSMITVSGESRNESLPKVKSNPT